MRLSALSIRACFLEQQNTWTTRLIIVSLSGGEEVLLDVGGQDATEAFEDVGHSDEAREILEGLLAGDLKRVVRPLFLQNPPHFNRQQTDPLLPK